MIINKYSPIRITFNLKGFKNHNYVIFNIYASILKYYRLNFDISKIYLATIIFGIRIEYDKHKKLNDIMPFNFEIQVNLFIISIRLQFYKLNL